MWARGPQYRAAATISFKIQIQTDSNEIQILSKFDRSKKGLSELKKIEIKYGCDVFEERDNFLHRNFFIFEMDFKRKNQRSL
jgi:hypothetical protein